MSSLSSVTRVAHWKWLPCGFAALDSRTFSPQRLSVRHGSKRTSSTPYHDPTDFTRDRNRASWKSLYQNPDDWTEEPIYPEIAPDPNTLEGIAFLRRKEGEAVAAIPTVFEKSTHFAFMPIPLTVKRRWRNQLRFQRRWQPFQVMGFSRLYNATPAYQYLTKTVVREGLPADYYNFLDEASLKRIMDRVRGPVMDALMMERKFFVRNEKAIPKNEQLMVKPAQNIIDAIANAVDSACAKEFPHLVQMQTDHNVPVFGFWRRSGYLEQEINEESCMKDAGEVLVQFKEEFPLYRNSRHEHPLSEVEPRNSSIATEAAVPQANFNPKLWGLPQPEFVPKWAPGFNYGDPCEFSTMSVNVLKNWDEMIEEIGETGAQENLVGNCVMGPFGRIVGQAHFLGFSFLNELTYPIVTQYAVTTGRDWIFSTYQANTIAVWKQDSENPLDNVCWITKPMRLFDQVTPDGVVGFNDEVLATFVKQYLKAPIANPTFNLRPYLPNADKNYWKDEKAGVPFEATWFGKGVNGVWPLPEEI